MAYKISRMNVHPFHGILASTASLKIGFPPFVLTFSDKMELSNLYVERNRLKRITAGLVPVVSPEKHAHSANITWQRRHTKDFVDVVHYLGRNMTP